MATISCSGGPSAGGCGADEPPETTEISSAEASFVYLDDGEPTVAGRLQKVPVAQRGAVRVIHPTLPDGSKSDSPLYVAELFEAPSGGFTVRQRSDDWIEAARQSGRTGAKIGLDVQSVAEQTATRIGENPFLWRVESEGDPVYLFGTMHIGSNVAFDARASRVKEAFRASDRIVIETSLSGVERKMRTEVQQMMTSGGSLKEQLDEQQWARLSAAVGSKIPGPAITRLEPWLAGLLYQTSGVDTETTMETALVERARVNGMEVAYLETAEDQFEALEEAYSIDVLRRILDFDMTPEEAMARLHEIYKAGEVGPLADAMLDTPWTADESDIRRIFLVERNRAWIPKIEAHIEQGDAFVAVGVAHLVGPDSVIAMLEEKGVDVERVR